MIVRDYRSEDYEQVEVLYKDTSTFGGQFDENRDTRRRLDDLISKKRSAIIVTENEGRIVGTVTVFEDGRSCWLYRFAVKDNDQTVASMLTEKAKEVAKDFGHSQFLVYAPAGDDNFTKRYTELGFEKGNDYTCYWINI